MKKRRILSRRKEEEKAKEKEKRKRRRRKRKRKEYRIQGILERENKTKKQRNEGIIKKLIIKKKKEKRKGKFFQEKFQPRYSELRESLIPKINTSFASPKPPN